MGSGANASEEDFRNAIAAVQAYSQLLVEVSNTLSVAVNQTAQNMPGDENVKKINANLSKRIVKIHSVASESTDLAKKLSLKLQAIIDTSKSLTVDD